MLNIWIEPDGTTHKVGLWGHNEFARKVVGDTPAHGDTATSIMIKRGWVAVATRSERSKPEVVWLAVTDDQAIVLKEHGLEITEVRRDS